MNKLIFVLVLLAIISLASAATQSEAISSLWGAWKSTHKKLYSPSEETHRFAIFQHNLVRIAKLNAQNSEVKLAVNQFADLTASEFKAKFTTGTNPHSQMNPEEYLNYPINGDLPDMIDWRNRGAVTAVKSQTQYCSGWTFGVTAVLESFNFIKTGKLISFSEQQIADCAVDAGKDCFRGDMYLGIAYASQYGLESEEDYPFTTIPAQCKYDDSKAIKPAAGYKFITPKSKDQLKAALVNNPVSVMVEADQDNFQFYSSGVIRTNCGANVSHPVLVVGYQKVGALESFIVKNSWSTKWGIEGYAYISTLQTINGGNGACGIYVKPMVPIDSI